MSGLNSGKCIIKQMCVCLENLMEFTPFENTTQIKQSESNKTKLLKNGFDLYFLPRARTFNLIYK